MTISKKTLNDIKTWSDDALDEEIFECEQTMVYEYIDGRGRKQLIDYWQALTDTKEKLMNPPTKCEACGK